MSLIQNVPSIKPPKPQNILTTKSAKYKTSQAPKYPNYKSPKYKTHTYLINTDDTDYEAVVHLLNILHYCQ